MSDTPQASAADPNAEVIIVAEDSVPNRNILTAIVAKLGFVVLAGESGAKGIALVDRCAKENLKLVAILSDIMMPEVDGLTFLEYVRKHDRYKDLPFLFVTAAADKGNVVEARKLGVTGYLLKPIDMEQIKAKIKELFPTRPLGDQKFTPKKVS